MDSSQLEKSKIYIYDQKNPQLKFPRLSTKGLNQECKPGKQGGVTEISKENWGGICSISGVCSAGPDFCMLNCSRKWLQRHGHCLRQRQPCPQASPLGSAAVHSGSDTETADKEFGLDFSLKTPCEFVVKIEGNKCTYCMRMWTNVNTANPP